MLGNKKLSIIIPYYNTYELTKELIEEIIPQLTEDVEVIVVDDGCKEERLDRYRGEIEVIHLEENKGSTYALNRGVERSIGRYIGVIDSDDKVSREYISKLIDAIDSREEEEICFGWKDIHNGVTIEKPHNIAIWKAIYKREILPKFREEIRVQYDKAFQEDFKKIEHKRYDIGEVLYYYNSRREGSLTDIRKKKIYASALKRRKDAGK